LSRTIEENISVFGNLVELFLKPVEILQQKLKAIYQSSIGSQFVLLHYLLHCDQISYVDAALVTIVVVGRVDIDYVDLTIQNL
jgi:hypothetical protein